MLTLDELDAIRFDFRSPAAVELATAAASKLGGYRPPAGVEKLILGLIGRGVPLEAKINGSSLATALVQVAATQAREAFFDKVAERGALAAMPRANHAMRRRTNGVSIRLAIGDFERLRPHLAR